MSRHIYVFNAGLSCSQPCIFSIFKVYALWHHFHAIYIYMAAWLIYIGSWEREDEEMWSFAEDGGPNVLYKSCRWPVEEPEWFEPPTLWVSHCVMSQILRLADPLFLGGGGLAVRGEDPLQNTNKQVQSYEHVKHLFWPSTKMTLFFWLAVQAPLVHATSFRSL